LVLPDYKLGYAPLPARPASINEDSGNLPAKVSALEAMRAQGFLPGGWARGLRRIQMKLSEEQIKDALSRLADWRREGDGLTRDLKFENFKGAMEFVNRVADEAEAMDHHPDILIHGWNKVRLSVMTHSEGGLTEKDFKLAERINGLV
jgi:4a-hydroxytetrahydrobiopterin dehydratase